MKILLATFWPTPHVGGVWPYMLQLKKKLESLGHEVDLLGNGDDAANSFIYIVNEDRRIEKSKLLPLLKAKLTPSTMPYVYKHPLVEYNVFQRYAYELAAASFGLDKYDVIHTQDIISTACIRRVKPPEPVLVATVHGCVAHEIRRNLDNSPSSQIAREYYDLLERDGATSADYTIVANDWLMDIYTNEFQIPAKQLKKFHYGFDIEPFLERMKQSSAIGAPPNKKVITFTGRLIEQKGVHFLLNALEQLKDRDDWVCWIVGVGEKEAELRIECKVLELEKLVHFWGKRDDVPYLLSISDIFVLPSIIENQPLSVIEAQLAGLATIVSNAGGLPEMIEHGVTGLLFPVGDEQALTEQIRVLLDDDQYRKTLGKNAKRWGLGHWSMNIMVDHVLDVYKSAAKKKKYRRKLSGTTA